MKVAYIMKVAMAQSRLEWLASFAANVCANRVVVELRLVWVVFLFRCQANRAGDWRRWVAEHGREYCHGFRGYVPVEVGLCYGIRVWCS